MYGKGPYFFGGPYYFGGFGGYFVLKSGLRILEYEGTQNGATTSGELDQPLEGLSGSLAAARGPHTG